MLDSAGKRVAELSMLLRSRLLLLPLGIYASILISGTCCM